MTDWNRKLAALRDHKGPQCVSDYEMDRLQVGAGSVEERRAIEARIESCDHCRLRFDRLRASTTEPKARVPRALTRTRRRTFALGLGVAAAAAVGLVLTVAPEPERSGIRLKGGDRFEVIVVAPSGEVRDPTHGRVALAGDELQWRVRPVEDAYVAVLSKDDQGRARVYFPQGATAAPVAGGVLRVLPMAARLDGASAYESILGVLCPSPIRLERLVRGAEGDGFPDGCIVKQRTVHVVAVP